VAYSNRAWAKGGLEMFREAIPDADKAIQLDPSNSAAYDTRAAARHGLKMFREAISDADMAIQLNPDKALAYSHRGSSKIALGQIADAFIDLDRAIKIDPTDAEPRIRRGLALFKLGKTGEALVDIGGALVLEPENKSALEARDQILAASQPSSSASSALLDAKNKTLLGEWAAAAQSDLLTRLVWLCTEDAAADLVPATSAIIAQLKDHATAAGAPYSNETAPASARTLEIARSMADLAALRDELDHPSGPSSSSLRSRIEAMPTHGVEALQTLAATLLAKLPSSSKRPSFNPNIPRSSLTLEDDPFDEGAFSEVFHGSYDGAPIVAKVFKTGKVGAEELKAQVAKEASLLDKCQHPNIVRSYGVCADFTKKKPFVALVLDPYTDGTLTGLLERTGPLPGRVAAHILEGVAWGLDALHRQGIIHKDIKADNILLERDDDDPDLFHGVVADFGLSVDLAFSSARTANTSGTWNHQSPEQLKPYDGKGEPIALTAKVDLYALGVVAWTLATNKTPWDGDTQFGLIQRVVDLNQRLEFPPPPDKEWAAIRALALRCFETDPQKRPTAQEMAKALSTAREK
jgi:serine/threonine protein kinase